MAKPSDPNPADPRVRLSRHRERGPKKFFYTYADIARICGLSVASVQTYASRGDFEPGDLESVIAFVVARRRPDGP
jgi:hypothetical protein